MKSNSLALVLMVSSFSPWIGGCSKGQPDVDVKPKVTDKDVSLDKGPAMRRVAVAPVKGKPLVTRPGEAEALDMVWSQDGKRLGVWMSDGTYEVFDAAGNLLDTLHGKETTLSRLGAITIPSGTGYGTFRTSVRGGTVARTFTEGISICNLHDLASGHYFDLSPNRLPFELPSDGTKARVGPHSPATLLPDGKTLLVVSDGKGDRSLVSYDLTERKATGRNPLPFASSSEGAALSSDGTKLAWIGYNSAQVFDLKDGKPSAEPSWTFEFSKNQILDLRFSPKGRYVAAYSKDATIIVVNAADGKKYHEITTIGGEYESFAFSPDDSMLAVSIVDEKVRTRQWHIIDLATKETLLKTGLRDRLVWHPFQKMFAHLNRTAKGPNVEVYEFRR